MARDLAQEQRWRDRIEEFCQSGLSIKDWCVQNGLKNTAYHYWASYTDGAGAIAAALITRTYMTDEH